MYSWEIRKFLEERDYYIGGDDLLKVIDIKENPQLTHIKFSSGDGSYYMKDKDGEEFNFKAMPYEEAVEKNLVKVKSKTNK